MAAPIRLLTFSTLFPNTETPNHGVFVENRLRHLVESGEAEAVVVAPVPYFPSGNPVFGEWGRSARVPSLESRGGIEVHHPRYLVIPRYGMSIAPLTLGAAGFTCARRLIKSGVAIDLIDAHYFFPDGVAAVRMGKQLGKPVVITARGSDVEQLPGFARPRRAIVDAIRRADWMITVSASLRDGLLALGAPASRTTVLRNGVDTKTFHPMDRAAARASLGLTRPTLISVGLLIPRKRHHLIIKAMKSLPDCELLIVGEGPERASLQALAARLGVNDRVRLLGAYPHAELPRLYSAADVSVLASSREGWANVLLESMACGTPVVAARIGGNAEVVQGRQAGLIIDEASPETIAEAMRDLLSWPPDRAATRAYAEGFGWNDTTAGQLAIFREVLARHRRAQSA